MKWWMWTDSPRANAVVFLLALGIGRQTGKAAVRVLSSAGVTGSLPGLAVEMLVGGVVAAAVISVGFWAYRKVYAPSAP